MSQDAASGVREAVPSVPHPARWTGEGWSAPAPPQGCSARPASSAPSAGGWGPSSCPAPSHRPPAPSAAPRAGGAPTCVGQALPAVGDVPRLQPVPGLRGEVLVPHQHGGVEAEDLPKPGVCLRPGRHRAEARARLGGTGTSAQAAARVHLPSNASTPQQAPRRGQTRGQECSLSIPGHPGRARPHASVFCSKPLWFPARVGRGTRAHRAARKHEPHDRPSTFECGHPAEGLRRARTAPEPRRAGLTLPSPQPRLVARASRRWRQRAMLAPTSGAENRSGSCGGGSGAAGGDPRAWRWTEGAAPRHPPTPFQPALLLLRVPTNRPSEQRHRGR